MSARVLDLIHAYFRNSSPRQDDHFLPVAVIPAKPKAKPSSSRYSPDPWPAMWETLDKQDAEFARIERELEASARRDGLDDDGPMTLTLAALRLCIQNLRETSRVTGRMLRHYTGQVLDALGTAQALSETEAARFKLELQHTKANVIYEVAHAIADSAKTVQARRIDMQWWRTVTVGVCALAMTFAGGAAAGYLRGQANATIDFARTETQLRDAFAQDPATARAWANIIRFNAGSAAASFKQCFGSASVQTDQANGRRSCNLPIWIDADNTVPVILSDAEIAAGLAKAEAAQRHQPDWPDTAQVPEQPLAPLGITLPRPPTGPLQFGPERSQ